ncbi:MAG TPA: hypothetical protein VF824_19740 [Thermoanaerobaculia bacterium]|jgi:hypothetical protein
MMIHPGTMALATITVMLWIIWSDTIRARKPAPILYAVRIALFLIVSGILVLNVVRYPRLFAGGARAMAILAVAIGIGGAAYFAKRLGRR